VSLTLGSGFTAGFTDAGQRTCVVSTQQQSNVELSAFVTSSSLPLSCLRRRRRCSSVPRVCLRRRSLVVGWRN
jgi:hypothetical protein